MGKYRKFLFLMGMILSILPVSANTILEQKDIFLKNELTEQSHWTDDKKEIITLISLPINLERNREEKKIEELFIEEKNDVEEIVFDINESEKTVYAISNVNVRTMPSKDSEKLGSLSYAEEIKQLGTCDNGWTQVIYNNQIAYISSSYLQDTKPEKIELTTSAYSGIIQKQGNVSDTRLANIEAYYVKIPQNIRTYVESLGWKYVCSDNNFGAQYGYTGSILALSVYDEKLIYIDNRQKAEDAIIHEVGHALDWSLGFISYQQEFLNIFYAEVETFRTIDQTHANNTASTIEYFAEAFAFSILNPTLMQLSLIHI